MKPELPVELKAVCNRWKAQRPTCALLDSGHFVRNLEQAYRLVSRIGWLESRRVSRS